MAEKRPPLPLLLTAQELRGGGVVYWDGHSWVPAIEDALVADDEAAAATLDADRVNADPALVIDPFLFTVRDGVPAHFRERARLIGPSFRDDFGRNPLSPGRGADHVPL